MNKVTMKAQAARPAAPTHLSKVYCPMCTHTVEAQIEHVGRHHAQVAAGQKCPRCAGSLDAGFIFHMDRAA